MRNPGQTVSKRIPITRDPSCSGKCTRGELPLANYPLVTVPVTDESVALVVQTIEREKHKNLLCTSKNITVGEIRIARAIDEKTFDSRVN